MSLARVCSYCRDPAAFITCCTVCGMYCCDACTVLIWCEYTYMMEPHCFGCESTMCEECNGVDVLTYRCVECKFRRCLDCWEEYGTLQGAGVFLCHACSEEND
jgi:hypothetical protein